MGTDTATADDRGHTAEDPGVEGNARLTGIAAAVLLVALAVEGVTIWDVRQMVVLHFFIGLFVIPVTVVKLGSTGWRFLNYYRGEARYRRKGPPHPILRILAPLVVLSTIALLATGVTLLVIGPDSSSRDTVTTLHQGSFIVWVAVMTVHVLGHIRETYLLTRSELGPRSPRVRGRGMRGVVVATSLVVGLGLGIGSLTWNHSWKNRTDRREHDGVGTQVTGTGR